MGWFSNLFGSKADPAQQRRAAIVPIAPKPWILTAYWCVDIEDRRTYSERSYQPRKGQERNVEIRVGVDDFVTLPYAFMRAVMMEGTGLFYKQVLNYMGHGKWAWQNPVKYPYGRGASGEAIVPFVSVAVDRKRLKLRTNYRIPELAGIKLPDGSGFHTGIVRAVDTGGRIKGRRIDWNCGRKAWFLALRKQAKFPLTVHVEGVLT